MSQDEFTITFQDDTPGPPFPDCHCGRFVSDERMCSGCNLHPWDCGCSPLDEDGNDSSNTVS